MIQIALSLLALAAGVYLLIQVRQSGLGGLYKLLSWLVVVLSIGFILCGVARGVHHARHMDECRMSGHCGSGPHGDMGCPYMKGGCGDHGLTGTCSGDHKGCGEDGKPACCKDTAGAAKPACCGKDGAGTMPACCKKGGAKSPADSVSKK